MFEYESLPQHRIVTLADLVGNKVKMSDTHIIKELVTSGWRRCNANKDKK